MSGQELYEKAIVLGALPTEAADWWKLRVPQRDGWDELAAQAKNTWVCSDCGDAIEPESIPELVRE